LELGGGHGEILEKLGKRRTIRAGEAVPDGTLSLIEEEHGSTNRSDRGKMGKPNNDPKMVTRSKETCAVMDRTVREREYVRLLNFPGRDGAGLLGG
jgi:hypothetical protein